MPTRNVNLTTELDQFVLDKVKSGRYENASEVVRAALRILERDEREYQDKLTAIRAAVQEGLDSGVEPADGPTILARVREDLGLPVRIR